VSTAELAAVTAAPTIQAELSALQKIVKADKSAIVAAIVHVAVLLVGAFSLHLTAQDTAVLSSIVTAGLAWFLTLNLSKGQ
jgi:hypothetical protein